MSLKHWYHNPDARQWRTEPPRSALAFHRSLDGYQPTSLTSLPALADELGVGQVHAKDESQRLGLPAFKVLGASWATCRALCERLGLEAVDMTLPRLRDHLLAALPVAARPVLVTATDGNHGWAVARVAALLGLAARVYIPTGVSENAVSGIRGEGAELVALDRTYDEVIEAAAEAAANSETDLLIQDTAWEGYVDIPRWIVEGYGTLFREIDDAMAAYELPGPHLVACPVGVGSFAHAMVDHYRSPDGDPPALLSVEPETAACIAESLVAAHPVSVDTSYPSIMTGLNCGTPSGLGWPSLLAGLDAAVSVTEDECRQAVRDLTALGQVAGPCGAATLAGVRKVLADSSRREQLGITRSSVLVLLITEGLAANPLR
ncbi:diaminopropionate ammonia-lyase [Saccharopolyspora cebuensis]|uniref:Diaminopropionate ammonia-lyase n=1 Tax=Saccharopolyspora cebuensis TaxID=418759 RepID=A0ABV4CK89_9PSEU